MQRNRLITARDPPALQPRALRAGGGRGKGDERILGSGEFVEEIPAESNESHSGKRFEYDRHGSRQVRGEGKKDT